MKKKGQNNKRFLFFIAFFVSIILIALLLKVFYVPTKTYHSDFLKISIDYPSNYQMEERFGTITLQSAKGKITVGSNGTNYESIDEYLEDLSHANNFTITNKEKIKFKYELATLVTIDNEKKDYFFYPAKWSVYVISASSSVLYPDLDRIAKSFRYEP